MTRLQRLCIEILQCRLSSAFLVIAQENSYLSQGGSQFPLRFILIEMTERDGILDIPNIK